PPADATQSDAGEPAAAICTSDHWCWENPFPQGNDLFAGTGDFFAGTETILEHDATGWRARPSPPWVAPEWRSIWPFGSRTWIAGGIGALTEVSTSTMIQLRTYSSLNQVWGLGPDDIWAVGTGAGAFHYDGSTWGDRSFGGPSCTQACTSLYGIWGASS